MAVKKPRPVTLFTGQWADLPRAEMFRHARASGYDGVEVACWGDHINVRDALREPDFYIPKLEQDLRDNSLRMWAISAHLVGQAVCDRIDPRHKTILPEHVWGDGDPEGVRTRAASELMATATLAKKLCLDTVNGFTGSSIWHLLYSFPPVPAQMINEGYDDFARRFGPILDHFQAEGVKFALEVHPTEIAFDIPSARRALEAVGNHQAFGFNYDPSHFGYQGVDYLAFLDEFADRIFHVHMKDVWWSERPTTGGVFGGHTNFGAPGRYWDFRSLGRGRIDFEEIVRRLNRYGYSGPLSVEWEDGGMDRFHGAKEACRFVRGLDFPPSALAFDGQFAREGDSAAQ